MYLEKALVEFSDTNAYVRRGGVRKLGEIGTSEVVPYLIEALKDDDDDVRYDAAIMLGRIADPRAVEHLIPKLLDNGVYSLVYGRVYFVSEAAAGALEQISTDEAVDALGKWDSLLLRDLHRDDHTGKDTYGEEYRRISHAAVMLGRHQVVEAVPRLIQLLDDKDEFLPEHAAEALEEIGTPEAVAAVRDWQDK